MTNKAGAKSKASKGLQRYKKINATIPPELFERLLAAKGKGNQTFSALIAELLEIGLEERKQENNNGC